MSNLLNKFTNLNRQKKLHSSRLEQVTRLQLYLNEFFDDEQHTRIKARCPLCANNLPVSFEKNNGKYSYCGACNLVYLKNPLSDETLRKFYANYPSNTANWHKNESKFYKTIYRQGINSIRNFLTVDSPKILDVGCSSGLFLDTFGEIYPNASLFGIEPNIIESQIASSKDISLLPHDISNLNPSDFDFVTLWDVLEHIPNPVKFLRTLKCCLKPEGILFIQVPSCDSISARILQEKCNMYDGIEHLTLFGVRGIHKALDLSGLVPVSCETVISDSFPIANHLNYDNPYYPACNDTDYQNSLNIITSFLDEKLILSQNLGYKIQVTCKLP